MGTRGLRVRRLVVRTAVVLPALSVPATVQAAPDPVTATSVGQQAYDYGFPLLELQRVRREQTSVSCPDGRGNGPVNMFSNATGFPTAADRTVVAPNTDTLYSIAHLDLGRGPLVLRYPRMGKRYFSFAMLDPYTNVVATPGTREDGGSAGRVLIRWTGRPGRAKAGRYDRVVRSPYRRLWVIGRTLATDAADQRKAHRLMRRYAFTTTRGRVLRAPAGCTPQAPRRYPAPTSGAAFLDALQRAMRENPPPARDAPLVRTFAGYGIGSGATAPDPVTQLALRTGVETEARSLPLQAKLHALGEAQRHGGWYSPEPAIGRYGTDYRLRAFIAALGLGANTREEAIYPAAITDVTGVPFSGADRYRLTFAPGQLPPARFFWSLTLYDLDGYLVDGVDGRHSVGPTHPPLLTRPDGSVVIEIARTRPAATGVNWLPAPAGGYRLNLRLYGPGTRALDGTWTPPGVVDLGPQG